MQILYMVFWIYINNILLLDIIVKSGNNHQFSFKSLSIDGLMEKDFTSHHWGIEPYTFNKKIFRNQKKRFSHIVFKINYIFHRFNGIMLVHTLSIHFYLISFGWSCSSWKWKWKEYFSYAHRLHYFWSQKLFLRGTHSLFCGVFLGYMCPHLR